MRVVDADAHVVEPRGLFVDSVDRRFADRAPRIAKDEYGRDRVWIDGRPLGGGPSIPSLGAGVVPGGLTDSVKVHEKTYDDAPEGGADPRARLRHMDAEGIDVSVFYPTMGLFLAGIDDPAFAAACCRCYNDWLATFCAADRNRLVGVAVVPQQDIDRSIEEARRAVCELGMRGVVLRPNPCRGRRIDHPAYDPLWRELQDLRCPVAIHEGTTLNVPTVGADRYDDIFRLHTVSHAFEQKLACMDFIVGGVLERHPNLRVAFLESGGTWVPHWLDRLDHQHETMGWIAPSLKLKPSDYFKRQCWISFDPDETLLEASVMAIGDNRVMWGSDYPHFDCIPSGAVRELRRRVSSLPEPAARGLLGANAAAFYGLDV